MTSLPQSVKRHALITQDDYVPPTHLLTSPNSQNMDQALPEPTGIEGNGNDRPSVQVEPESEPVQLIRQRISNIRKRKPQSETAEDFIPGLSNEDLWMLIRRFNKVCRAIDIQFCYNMPPVITRQPWSANIPCHGCYRSPTAETRPQSCRG